MLILFQEKKEIPTGQKAQCFSTQRSYVRTLLPLEVFAAKSTAYGRVLRARVWFCANEMIGKSVENIRESTCGVDRWKCIGNPLYVSSKCLLEIIWLSVVYPCTIWDCLTTIGNRLKIDWDLWTYWEIFGIVSPSLADHRKCSRNLLPHRGSAGICWRPSEIIWKYVEVLGDTRKS